jgi:hypothetical protein
MKARARWQCPSCFLPFASFLTRFLCFTRAYREAGGGWARARAEDSLRKLISTNFYSQTALLVDFFFFDFFAPFFFFRLCR